MKKMLSVFITLMLLLAILLPVAALAEDVYTGSFGENITFNFDTATATLTLTGTGDMVRCENSQAQPWYSYKDTIRKVVVSEGITSLGDWFCAYCSNVSEVVLPQSSLETIGMYVFVASYAGDFIIPEGVDTIAWYAFSSANFATVTIPSSVIVYPIEVNGGNPFNGCSKLKSITVHDDNPILLSDDGVLYTKDYSVLLALPYMADRTEFACNPITTAVAYTVGCFIPASSPLTKIYFGDKLSVLGNFSFGYSGSSKLEAIYFYGNAPSVSAYVLESPRRGLYVYRLDTATGWGDKLGGATVKVFKASDIPDPWAPEITYILGDVNGDMNVSQTDALLMLRYLQGWDITINEKAADINGDNDITQLDALLLLRHLQGWTIEYFG